MGDNCIFTSNSDIFVSSVNGRRVTPVMYFVINHVQCTIISLTAIYSILRLRNEIPIKRAGEKSCTTQFSFKRRDGSEMIIPIRSGLHSVSLKVILLLFDSEFKERIT